MSERHGIERLRWLVEDDPHFGTTNPNYPLHVPRMTLMDTKEVEVEVAFALVEELHDAIARLDHPHLILHASSSPIDLTE